MGGDDSKWNVGDWHVPTVVAAAFWFASALGVLGYTVIAFKETATSHVNPLDQSPPGKAGPYADPEVQSNIDIAAARLKAAGEHPGKKLDRQKFVPSPDAPKGSGRFKK